MSKGGSNRVPQEIEAKVIQLYQDGLSLGQVAQHLNIGNGTVYRTLQRNGIPFRKYRMHETDEVIAEIRKLCESGVGIRDIAKQLNVSISPIQRIMQENGIESIYGIG